jgi:hypothetical protein
MHTQIPVRVVDHLINHPHAVCLKFLTYFKLVVVCYDPLIVVGSRVFSHKQLQAKLLCLLFAAHGPTSTQFGAPVASRLAI